MRIFSAMFALLLVLASCASAPGSGGNAPEDGSIGAICGGLRGLSCGAGAYCQYPAGARCGAADGTGICRPVPQACTMQYDPVCGCDGKTYGNACTAAGASVSVARRGACEGPGAVVPLAAPQTE